MVMETGHPILNHEELIVRENDEVIWIATTKVPLNDVEGNCIGLVGVSTDISIRKEAEERLRLAAEQLRRSNAELQDFASVASHDLQEPLRKIQAFGDRLKIKCSAALGDNGRDYLDRMQDAARRMQILLHDLLTLSRITSKGQPFEPVDLKKIVEDVVTDLEVRIEQTSARVEIGFLPVIDADAGQMRQLIQNLISNALKFHDASAKPEVIISAKVLDNADSLAGSMPGEEICHIVIQDNGIGFDEKYLDRIFQVFQRLHSRSAYEGTGIGLAVCRKIAERHGGTISAKSSEGDGATFIVTLPMKQRMSETNE
jgi:light-regulated signal transduction histidine kinase (bacteriophytochrome)